MATCGSRKPAARQCHLPGEDLGCFEGCTAGCLELQGARVCPEDKPGKPKQRADIVIWDVSTKGHDRLQATYLGKDYTIEAGKDDKEFIRNIELFVLKVAQARVASHR